MSTLFQKKSLKNKKKVKNRVEKRTNVCYTWNSGKDDKMFVQELKGVGPKVSKAFEKLNINSIEDLLLYYPYRYLLIKRSNLETLNQNDSIIMDGVIENVPTIFRFGRKMNKMNFRLNTGIQILQVTIYNRGFLKNKLTPGISISVFGKYDLKHHTIIANDIKFGLLPNKPTVESIYHETSGITSKQIRSLVEEALQKEISIIDFIPSYLSENYRFPSKLRSIEELHFPTSTENLRKARTRAKYEELFLFMLKMNILKTEKEKAVGIERNIEHEKLEEFLERLPFTLTKDQRTCVEDIYKDLNASHKMSRLVQGDVGSGKTIVAFISMYLNFLSGYQSALMAPTEILAIQHYHALSKLLEGFDIKIGLLTGKLKVKEKRMLLEKVESGEINMIIGTHALISENVVYANLGLVITDEQHRFGVNQRKNLKNKGNSPDILYMSATPIPRTYALTLYGDMDVSTIKTMPNGRIPIQTYVKTMDEITWVLESMLEELKKGHQIYVIAPLIEETENSNSENVKALEEKMKKAFGKYFKIGILHGKMKNIEKEEVMNAFQSNDIQILISTTVIEVGVDVANATMMVIFDSDHFGLSSLHQLRGRVGRNQLQSYCILISKEKCERLSILENTSDGFQISEEDFKLRGSGDLFGYRQSGDMQFKVANIKEDFELLLRAKKDCEEYMNSEEYKVEKDVQIVQLFDTIKQLD